MNRTHRYFKILFCISFMFFSGIAAAQTVKTEGLIKGRSGATLLVQTSDATELVVLLTDNTQCGQVQGVFKTRRKDMSMAALVPGLAIKVEGTYDSENRLVAKIVKFSGDDLKRAQSIQAGITETPAQAHRNKEELEKQSAASLAQSAELKKQQ